MLFKTVGLLMSLLTDALIVKSLKLPIKVFISSFLFTAGLSVSHSSLLG